MNSSYLPRPRLPHPLPAKPAARVGAAIAGLLLAGCAIYPTGPSQMALPGTSATFEQFQADDMACQAYAQQASGASSAQQGAQQGAVDSAVAGTVVGAAAGAVIGAAVGDPVTGAGIGAGSGLLLGSASGTEAYRTSGYRMQERYDNAYIQCMYARGHQVPVPASVAAQQAAQAAPAQVKVAPGSSPSPAAAAYPPPNTPPPPGY
ncbi:MAG: glycine zipper family protein [Gammaproteobacteria bacterium]